MRDSFSWESCSKGMVNTLRGSMLPVKWKKIAREECGQQQCWKCKKKFQKCRNSAIACMYHPQGRELIEDKSMFLTRSEIERNEKNVGGGGGVIKEGAGVI